MSLAQRLAEIVKATVIGGLMFMVPVVLIAVVLGKAMQLAHAVAEPLATALPKVGVLGVGSATLLAAMVLVLISLLAGLVAKTAFGRRVTRWFEDSLLGGLPQYQLVKSMAEGLAHVESEKGIKPALVSIEDGWQIGYLLETLEDGWAVVFLPQAPTPTSGNVMILQTARIRVLDVPMTQAMAIVKRLGVGSAAALRSVDLTLPRRA